MRRDNVPRIRALLRQYPQGLTVRTISNALGIANMSVRAALHFYMVDAYIKGYAPPSKDNNHRAAVWTLVAVPKHAPYPKRGSRYDDGATSVENLTHELPKETVSCLSIQDVDRAWRECGGLRKTNVGERWMFALAIERIIQEKRS